jgi:hypothetical protein
LLGDIAIKEDKMNLKLLGGVASAALIAASPAWAGFGGTHTDTQVENKTVTEHRHATRTHTVHQPNAVDNVTHVRDVTCVHPVHHVTEVTRYLHHVVPKDEDQYLTHRSVAPEQIETTHSTEQVGGPAPAREHTVTRYHDVYQDDYQTKVHEVPVTDIDHRIHRHVTEVTVQPILHEHDVTRVVLDNHYVPRTVVEPVTASGKARTIVTHKREDIDP